MLSSVAVSRNFAQYKNEISVVLLRSMAFLMIFLRKKNGMGFFQYLHSATARVHLDLKQTSNKRQSSLTLSAVHSQPPTLIAPTEVNSRRFLRSAEFEA